MFDRRIARNRLFYALRPPLVLARQIINGAEWFDGAGRSLPPDHLHDTIDILDDLGTVPKELESVLLEVGGAIAVAPFEIVLDLAIGSARSVALRPRRKIAALDALQDEVVRHRRAGGIAGRQGYEFNPHMTIGYRDGKSFVQPIAPIRWMADELVLVHSHLGKTRHDILGRWRLREPQTAQLALL